MSKQFPESNQYWWNHSKLLLSSQEPGLGENLKGIAPMILKFPLQHPCKIIPLPFKPLGLKIFQITLVQIIGYSNMD